MMLEGLLGFDLTQIIIIICVVALLIALVREKHNRPIIIVILCIAWLGLGIYSGVTLYKYERTQSEVRGEPEIHDPYEDFKFYEYDVGKNLVWYQNEDGTYYYQIEYATSIAFEGEENKYQLLVNNSPCTRTTSSYGRLYGLYQKQFKDLDGQVTDTINFEITFAFSSSQISLTITTDATSENIATVREYVNVNGFELRIIDTIYTSSV